ncbi:MAG: hypothetical protein VKJ27_07645 [Synechocystis sp.]|nr:hypothetical protein [Synechocystis sp.]
MNNTTQCHKKLRVTSVDFLPLHPDWEHLDRLIFSAGEPLP